MLPKAEDRDKVPVFDLTRPLRCRWADKNKDAADKALQPRTPAEVASSHILNFIALGESYKKLESKCNKYLIFISFMPYAEQKSYMDGGKKKSSQPP
ncbi:hypothetical protein EXN66_Car010794 [Channa argus]|uniref:Uncharacterized protein n=1 Tax=Channa argus TaxID=215402 RepID=A0A6G1PYR2_CHAAH|nr:hypothetical protein EXN66_Car010794 [Channa argus]